MSRRSSSSRRRRMILSGGEESEAVDALATAAVDEDAAPTTRPAPDDRPTTIPIRINDVNQPWRSELRRLLDGMQPLTWVFTGDGATQAARHTDGRRGYVELVDARIRGGLRRLLDVVVNTALEGGRAGTLLRNRDWRIGRFRPDVVSMMLGFADSTAGERGRDDFRETLHELVDGLLEDGVVVVLNTPHRPNPRSAGPHADLPAYVRIVRETADELGVPLVDHWMHWKRADGAALLSDDGLHPNAHGQSELARLLQRELGIDRG